MSGPFHRWLVETQIEPAFRAHAFLEKAEVLIISRLWLVERAGEITKLMIFYGASSSVVLDATVHALAHDEQDPNLPAGISNYDIYAPITAADAGVAAPPFEFCARESFHGATRDAEHGFYELLDHFAVYATFARGPVSGVECVRYDAKLGAMIDHVVPVSP